MEKTEHTIVVCNHAEYSGACTRLNLWGNDGMKIYPRIEVIKGFLGEVGERLTDFIEIATYLYAVDQMVVRCQGRVDQHGFLWNRNITMIIAVQDYEFWSRSEVVAILQETMNFLSDDRVIFQFEKMTNRPPGQQYFRFTGDETGLAAPPEQVMLFSGGLDSLGGRNPGAACRWTSDRSYPSSLFIEVQETLRLSGEVFTGKKSTQGMLHFH